MSSRSRTKVLQWAIDFLISRCPARKFICLSCATQRNQLIAPSRRPFSTSIPRLSTRLSSQSDRSSLRSSTAINAVKDVRPAVQQLYDALAELRDKAPVYVNLSRLQLALSSLESGEHAKVRIAVLGVNNHAVASRLAKVLLADPLKEEQEWERKLSGLGEDGRSVLLRHGETFETISQNSLLTTLAIPSTLLRERNLEFLVSCINTVVQAQDGTGISADDAILVPTLEAASPTLRGGPSHYSIVRYPVHRSIVVAEGLEDILSLAQYTKMASKSMQGHAREMTKCALSLPLPTMEDPRMSPPISSTNAVVDLTLADRAILSIRSSPAKALEYEHDWSKSNVSELSNWTVSTLHATSKSSEGLACLRPAVCTLIESILDTTAASLSSRLRPPPTNLSEGQQASLDAALLRFSTRAHSSLLQNLDHAFDPLSSPLSSLPFYALLFRIDDLPTLTANLLSRYFLVTPDKEFIFLTARLLEAGYFQSSLTPRSPLEPIDAERVISDAHAETIATRRLGSIPPRPTFSDLVPPTPATTSLDQPPAIPEADRPDSPWHTPLATSRQQLISSTIPPLHAAAQRLLLHFLSTTSTSALLGVLVYISAVANAGAYEASALTALGLVIALRRLQTGWNRLRSSWEDDVREEGRRILREAESIVLVRIKRAQDSRSAEAAQLERESGHVEAMAAVNKVRQALTQLPVQKTSTS